MSMSRSYSQMHLCEIARSSILKLQCISHIAGKACASASFPVIAAETCLRAARLPLQSEQSLQGNFKCTISAVHALTSEGLTESAMSQEARSAELMPSTISLLLKFSFSVQG